MSSSTPTLSSLGVGSGLDLESIVTALVSARKSVKRQKVDQKQALKEIEVSGLSSLKSTLSDYKDYLGKVKKGELANKRTITTDFKSDDNHAFSYETTTSVTNSYHDISVTQLASGTKMTGVASSELYFSEPDSEGGTSYRVRSGGSINFTIGSGDEEKSFTVDIADNSSIDTILKKVNSAEGNPGISLNYVVGSDNSVNFSLTSNKTGDGNELRISGDTEILGMTGDGSANIIQHAQNAKMVVDSVEISSSTNSFDNQVSGIKLTACCLSEKNDDGTWKANKLSISEDKENFKTFTNDFVTKFNDVLSKLDKLYAKNTYTDGKCNYDGGDLAGDSLCTNLKSVLKNSITTFVPSSGKLLYSYGISIDKNGQLSIDSDKLNKAADGSYDQLISVFEELSEKVDKTLETYTKSGGILSQRSDSAKSSVDDYAKRLNNIDEYLSRYESTLRKKYTKLDTMLADMSTSMSYIQSITSQWSS